MNLLAIIAAVFAVSVAKREVHKKWLAALGRTGRLVPDDFADLKKHRELMPILASGTMGQPEGAAQRAPADQRSAILDALYCDYGQRRSEIMNLYQRYDKQAQTLTVYLTVVSLLTLALLSLRTPEGTLQLPNMSLKLPRFVLEHSEDVAVTVLSAGVLVALFYISNLMEILHLSALLSARSAAVEKAINDVLGMRLLTWDLEFVPEFYIKRWRRGAFVGPSV